MTPQEREAFEAMREALQVCPSPTDALIRNARRQGGADVLIREVATYRDKTRAALALAEKVSHAD